MMKSIERISAFSEVTSRPGLKFVIRFENFIFISVSLVMELSSEAPLSPKTWGSGMLWL